MKLKTKSQVTMLMIIGLVIFILVSFVLYISKSVVKKQSQQSIKRTQETAIDTQAIREFVAKCQDKLSKDAVVLLGKQGGYIYATQGGLTIDYQDTDEGALFANHDGFKVAYNILAPRFAVAPYSSDIPDYPWPTFPYSTSTSNAEIFQGFFGINNMPPVDSFTGPNSIQSQIESFIDKNMQSCINVDIFRKQGYEINIGNSNTSVTIGSNDMTIKSKIPVAITNPSTSESFKIDEFSTNVDLGIRDLYFFAKQLIDNDVKNIKFNISDIRNNRGNMNIKVIKHVHANDDLIIVTDENSLIYGRPYEYIFARKNRAPALYYIRRNALEFEQNHIITEQDILGSQPLKAEDPDEDILAFSVKALSQNPNLPQTLDRPQIKFKVEVTDGQLSDYQIITVNRVQQR